MDGISAIRYINQDLEGKAAWEAARATVGISKPIRPRTTERGSDQPILQSTVDIVRTAAEKPKHTPPPPNHKDPPSLPL